MITQWAVISMGGVLVNINAFLLPGEMECEWTLSFDFVGRHGLTFFVVAPSRSPTPRFALTPPRSGRLHPRRKIPRPRLRRRALRDPLSPPRPQIHSLPRMPPRRSAARTQRRRDGDVAGFLQREAGAAELSDCARGSRDYFLYQRDDRELLARRRFQYSLTAHSLRSFTGQTKRRPPHQPRLHRRHPIRPIRRLLRAPPSRLRARIPLVAHVHQSRSSDGIAVPDSAVSRDRQHGDRCDIREFGAKVRLHGKSERSESLHVELSSRRSALSTNGTPSTRWNSSRKRNAPESSESPRCTSRSLNTPTWPNTISPL